MRPSESIVAGLNEEWLRTVEARMQAAERKLSSIRVNHQAVRRVIHGIRDDVSYRPPETVAERLAMDSCIARMLLKTFVVALPQSPSLSRAACLSAVACLAGAYIERPVAESDPREWLGGLADNLLDQTDQRVEVRAKRWLDSNFSEQVTRPLLALRLNVHTNLLDRTFRRAYGLTIRQYLSRVRIDEGLRLLRHTDIKVEAIAHMVGYRSKKNFYVAVKRVTGLKPSQLRQ